MYSFLYSVDRSQLLGYFKEIWLTFLLFCVSTKPYRKWFEYNRFRDQSSHNELFWKSLCEKKKKKKKQVQI